MIQRLQETLAQCRKTGEKAMGIFITNGFPEPAATHDLLRAVDENGADFIELGMPFSDPLAEGLPIQRSSERALRHGTKMVDAFRVAESFRKSSETPLLLMGYVNPIMRYGLAAFCRDAAQSGVDGLILPDLPPYEADQLRAAADENGLAWVNLIAPNTSDERVRYIDEQTNGFVYAVSVTGLTGTNISTHAVSAYLERVRPLVNKNPLLVGFGIRNHQDAMQLAAQTDGFIVGSALINRLEALWDAPLSAEERLQQVGDFIRGLKYGA
ncbi:MAG: tryptophan synthase subunit alpha [Bacteroidetes Order II. Incertae sedis bacterium]|nr:tryptophan synthase subunit alpha [Bacteroidetes Order II. bacterium]